MKYFLAAFAICTVSAAAQAQTCSTVWVFKPWKSCAHASHGIDLSSPTGAPTVTTEWSPWYGGPDKPTQEEICTRVMNKYNAAVKSSGRVANLTQPHPVRERDKKNFGAYVEYTYECSLTVTQYATVNKASKACGEKDQIAYETGDKKRESIPGTPYCLSCDGIRNPSEKVACLKSMINDIIEPKAIDIRDPDLKVVAKAVSALVQMSKSVPIKGLNDDVDTFSLFTSFLEKNPPGN